MGREFKYLWVLKGNCENVILAKDAKEEIIYYEMVHVQNLNYFPGLNLSTCWKMFWWLCKFSRDLLRSSQGRHRAAAHAGDKKLVITHDFGKMIIGW